ncbi:MAG TPA: hypothetical protein VG713_03395, partial [Pirellulales bacterium]|nr:hypothetical protein [Pirellulales bacterium]
MQWIMTISATCLIAQMPAAPEHPHPHKLPTNQSPTDSEPRSKPIAAQWVAAMYPGAAAAQNPGRALPLVDVLKAVEDRSQQIAAVQAYWRLATAIAAFQAALEDVQRVEQFARRQPPGLPSAAGHPSLGLVWNARLAAARARLSEAQVAVTVAEQDISARIGLPANKQPLPSDLPLVSAYKTYYDQLSAAGRAMPVEARLIDRLLPLRREAIELEAAALQASVDWLDATDELSQRPSSDFENATTTLVAALDEIVARQAAFVAAVERYNDEIAVYALPLAAEGMRPEALAAMLVKAGPPSKETGATATTIPSAFDGPGAATPATFNESIDSNRVLPRAAPQMPRAAEPAQGPGPVEVRKPLSDAAPPASTNPGSGALFAGFEALSAARRAQELAANLHWDRAENPPLGKPISLDECMTHASLTERAAAIAAYWNTSRWTAQLQAANDCAEQLAALLPLAMRPAEASAEPEQMLRLREARLVADAAIVEARCELLKSQFTLGLRTHQSL